jgi:hypothetical protein
MPQAMTARLINAFGQPYAFGVAPPTALRTTCEVVRQPCR